MDLGFTDRKWRSRSIGTARGICSQAISEQALKWELPARRKESLLSWEISKEALHLKEVWICRRCPLIVLLWYTNVNLRSLEVCPSRFKKVSCTTHEYKHWRSYSPSLFNSDLHLQESQAETHELGKAVHLQRDILFQACGLNNAVQSPRCQPPWHTIPAHTTHRASA